MQKSSLLALAAIACSACSEALGTIPSDLAPAESDPAPVEKADGVADGFLHVTWTLDGASTPTVCDCDSAGQIALSVDNDVREYGEFERDCRDFAATLRVAPNTYTVRAMMLDFSGVPLAPAREVGPVTVESNDEVALQVALTGRPMEVAKGTPH